MNKKQIIEKRILDPERLRKIDVGFAFIPHKFLQKGFFSKLSKDEISLYFFLVLAGDKDGISYFSQPKICNILKLDLDEYLNIRNSLIHKSLIAFDGLIFQVLSLPDTINTTLNKPLTSKEDFIKHDPMTIRKICRDSLSHI